MKKPQNSGRLPSFQFYPADWRKDPGVQSLDFETRGIWFEMLCLMHESEERGVLLLNGLPMPESALCRLLGLDNQNLTTAITTLLTYGVAHRREEDGALYNRRMVKDEALRIIRKNAGSLGGNPVLLNQKQTTQVKQNPTPSSSSSSSISSSSSSSEDNPPKSPDGGSGEKVKRPKKAPRIEIGSPEYPEGYPADRIEILTEFFNYKRERGEGFTSIGWRNLTSQMLKPAIRDLRYAASVSMARNYQGIILDMAKDLRDNPQLAESEPTCTSPDWLPENWKEIAVKMLGPKAEAYTSHDQIPPDWKFSFKQFCTGERQFDDEEDAA